MSVRFSASNAARLMACPASAHLDLAIPNWVEPEVDPNKGQKGVGTARHAMLEPLMALSPNDLQHMSDVIQYVADLRKLRRFNVLVKHTMEAHWLRTQPKTTADLVLYVADEMHIVDFKWGKIEVPAAQNVQLLYYAATYGFLAAKAKGVHLHILQPYAKNFEEWYATTDVIADFMERALIAEQKILNKDTTFGPSDDCKFCPANPHSRSEKGRPLCPAMMQMLYPSTLDEDEILNG